METPLILIDGNDVQFFSRKADLEAYVESPDVHSYKAYDSAGRRLALVADAAGVEQRSVVDVTNVRVLDGELSSQTIEELQDALISFATYLRVSHSASDLGSLISVLVEKFGFQR